MRPSPLLRDDRWARVAWSHVVEPDIHAVTRWLETWGPVEAFARLVAGDIGTHEGYRVRLDELDIEAAVRNAERLGVRALVPGDPEWPRGVEDLRCPPIVLYARGRGHVATLAEGSIAVVGSRAATAYGIHVAGDLAAGLAGRGVAVVSGAAYGIDAAAHKGCLAGGGETIAVLACGLDRDYPAAHSSLLAAVREQGVVLSELPVGFAPMAHRFIQRNRLIATVAVGTVVVEANLRSGSLNTARVAREHLRHVAAVPGPVTSVMSAGCHDLVRGGRAELVTDAGEVLELMGRMGIDLAEPKRAPDTPEAALDPTERAVYSAVPVRAPARVERLAVAAGVAPAAVLSILGSLELADLVRRDGDGWRKCTPSRRC